MHPVTRSLLTLVLASSITFPLRAQVGGDGDALSAETLSGLKLRAIGPALMGGRIADIAVSPRDPRTWYLAVGSGNVWKTENAGTTWTPIFDDQAAYSIGVVTLDPSNPDVVWVGTGENVSGRHVGWGDGVYKSLDGGQHWQNMGLARSEHIGKILVDPRDGLTVFVAAEGPLWSGGGDRGLYKTVDGGQTWNQILSVDEDTGVTDVEFDPRDPDVLYAATYQRRRSVWSLLAGGPGSGIHKSTDGGETWQRLDKGLPSSDMGKIGLAVSPANPDVVYATIEANEEDKGFYRSLDRGGSWEKRNAYISNGTGPHYYQEIEASPHDVGTVYQMDVFIHVTRDGGANFEVLGTGREKHSDNHALYIDPADPQHLLAGTDASLYESFDDGQTWRQSPNLPISQFYKLAVDNAEPFYNILGGAQDLGTLLGPSRTPDTEGVRNRDWYVPLGADGYSCAFDPENPDLMYMEIQVGNLKRYDRRSHEIVDIQPVPDPGEPAERWNWDAPLLISPHSASRLYFGSQRLWRSDDRGNSWTAVSADLTHNRNRYEMEMLGRVQSIDALYGNTAMSWYGTLTAVSESPLVEGLLYVGTDDGRVQVSENGGGSWRAVDSLPDVQGQFFVNDVEASLHDPDTVYAAVDAHKEGDFRPHLLKSTDRGQSWTSMAGDLPDRGITWAIEQDHIDPDLLFVGTEFGLYFTADHGSRWIELSGGVPTISFRDIALQRREHDLVGATFGRGFYVLDDYSLLREIRAGALEQPATLFPVRDPWWYVPLVPGQARGVPSLGSTEFVAPNPPFGALLTYFLRDTPKRAQALRRDQEKELEEEKANIPFPGWDALRAEALEQEPRVLLTIFDASGQPVRRIEGPATAGVHRVNWDLRWPAPNPIELEAAGFRPPWASDPQGPLAPPGRYRVELALITAAGVQPLDEPREFEVRALPTSFFPAPDYTQVAAFHRETGELLRQASGASRRLGQAEEKLPYLRKALVAAPRASTSLFEQLDQFESELAGMRRQLQGDPILNRFEEPSVPSILGRAWGVAGGTWDTRQAPTLTQQRSLAVAQEEFAALESDLAILLGETLPTLEAELEAAGAPWTPGRDPSSE